MCKEEKGAALLGLRPPPYLGLLRSPSKASLGSPCEGRILNTEYLNLNGSVPAALLSFYHKRRTSAIYCGLEEWPNPGQRAVD